MTNATGECLQLDVDGVGALALSMQQCVALWVGFAAAQEVSEGICRAPAPGIKAMYDDGKQRLQPQIRLMHPLVYIELTRGRGLPLPGRLLNASALFLAAEAG